MSQYEAATRLDIVYAVHDGVELLADLYHPRGATAAPVRSPNSLCHNPTRRSLPISTAAGLVCPRRPAY